MRRIFLIVVICWSAIVDVGARGPWVTLEGGHFLSKRANDGDSFHISVEGKEYIFRLYFVDAPETTSEFRDRVEDQATYFGITVEQVLRLGALAKNYTREKLSGPFVVRTCWENAMGRSRLQRFYALVQTSSGDLGEQLVENGLARLQGMQASPEGITSARREWQRMSLLQQKAKREKIGGWGVSEDRMTTRTKDPQSEKAAVSPGMTADENPETTAVAPVNSSVSSENKINQTKLDVNTASAVELENVPGIGPALAQRIIDARPFNSGDDLQKVKGIGSGKKYEQIRPYFQ